jgi:hypothetical protein
MSGETSIFVFVKDAEHQRGENESEMYTWHDAWSCRACSRCIDEIATIVAAHEIFVASIVTIM